jgi:hypothetical protein
LNAKKDKILNWSQQNCNAFVPLTRSQNKDGDKNLRHKYTLVEMCELAKSRAVFRICHFLPTLQALMKNTIFTHRIKTHRRVSVCHHNKPKDEIRLGISHRWEKLLMSPLFVINYLYSFGKYKKWSNCNTANEGPARIQYKCLVPIYVFPEMKLFSLIIFKT